MTGRWHRLSFSAALGVASLGVALAIGLPPSAYALDTPNTLMGIDGMVLRAAGIFRDPGGFPPINGNDGFNTFQYGNFAINNAVTTGYGTYDSFRFQKTDAGDCCISHNARFNSNTPQTIIDDTVDPPSTSNLGGSINSNYFPVIDRAAFGQIFDPSEYQIEVKFKPLLTQATANSLGTNPYPSNPAYPNIPANLENTAPNFSIGLDLLGGYVWDAETSQYKRAGEGLTYNIGIPRYGDYNNDGVVGAADYTVWRDNLGQNVTLPNEIPGAETPGVVDQEDYFAWNNRVGNVSTPINEWYAGAPHDADGFATWTVPVTEPARNWQRTFYYSFGSGDFRDQQVVSNGGRRLLGDGTTWVDETIGFGPEYQMFGGGPSDPNNPDSKLDTPNGVGLISLSTGLAAQLGLSVEIKSVALTRIVPNNIMARIDANSGVSFRFGSGFTYGTSQPPIDVSGGPSGLSPLATDQISRFDENGMTNLTFNMRTPDDPTEIHRFLVRGAAVPSTFDATDAVVNVRAKLLQPITDPNIADSLTVYARARKGNDNEAGKGADEWVYELDLSQFNTSTMATVSIPMSEFTRNMTASELGPPLGFANFGDGLLTNFGLYEFGGVIPAGGGLLKLEMEFMEIRLPGGGGGQLMSQVVAEPATFSLLLLTGLVMLAIRRRAS